MVMLHQYFTPSECLELFDVPEAGKILKSIEKETGFDELPSFETLSVKIVASPIPKDYVFRVVLGGSEI